MASKPAENERNFWILFLLLGLLDLLIGWALSGVLNLGQAEGLNRTGWASFFWLSASILRWQLFRVQLDHTKWWMLAANLFALTSIAVGALSISTFFLIAANAAFPVSQLVLTTSTGALFGISTGVWLAWFIHSSARD